MMSDLKTIMLVSDLHGQLIDISPCDLLIIAGDLCPVEDHSIKRQRDWLDTEFREWLIEQPAKRIIGTFGNHDFVAEEGEVPNDLPGEWLIDEGTVWEGYNVWGSPYVNKFGNWAFMKRDEELSEHFNKIPSDTNILITHGPPKGILDANVHGEECGSKSLLDSLKTLDDLKLHVFGHIHEANGFIEQYHNASILNERYRYVNYPQIVRMKSRL